MKKDGPQFRREEYIARINRVIDFIETNIRSELTLSTLAGVANFSPFHFHRIFGAMVGETLNQFIQRIRIEKAVAQLAGNPQKSITEIALDCGFSGSASFARAFKESYGISASQWRTRYRLEKSKIRQTKGKDHQLHGKIGKEFDLVSSYIDAATKNQIWRLKMKEKRQLEFQVEVKEMPEMQLAYVRHIGPYAGDEALFRRLYEKLMKWAGPRGLLNFPETQILNIYHDDPNLTEASKLRLSVCITVPKDTKVDGEIGKMSLPAGKYAFARFELNVDEFGQAWDAVCGSWLPDSGYQPADGPCYEHCLNDPKEHLEGKHIVDIVIPVKPL